MIAPANADYNKGFQRMQALTPAGATVSASIGLNNYSYFQAFEDQLRKVDIHFGERQ